MSLSNENSQIQFNDHITIRAQTKPRYCPPNIGQNKAKNNDLQARLDSQPNVIV